MTRVLTQVIFITFISSLVGLIVGLRRPQTLSKFFKRKIPRILQVSFFLSLLIATFYVMRTVDLDPSDNPIETTPNNPDAYFAYLRSNIG